MTWTMIAKYLAENWLEIAGFLTTVLGIWLTTRRTLLCWPVILAADIFYLIVFYRAQLLSDALLQIFFLIFTLYGWWNWWRGVREEGEVRVVPLGFRSMVLAVIVGAVGSVVLGELAKRLASVLLVENALARIANVTTAIRGGKVRFLLTSTNRPENLRHLDCGWLARL